EAAAHPALRFVRQGTARGPRARPLPGARLDVSLDRGGLLEPVTTTHADARGGYRVVLDALGTLAPWARRGAEVIVEASARGHGFDRTVLSTARWVGEREVHADLELEPAIVLRGRVLAAEGRPAALVEIRVETRGPAVGIGGGAAAAFGPPAHVTKAFTDGLGRFALGLPSTAESYAVLARGDGGVARLTSRAVTGPEDITLDDLHLSAPGTVAGRVVFPDGSPVPGVWVQASAPRGAKHGLPSDLTYHRTQVRTDPQGGFEVPVLHAGPVALRIGASLARKTTTTVPADTRDAELVLRHRVLRIRVRGDEGTPIPGADVFITSLPASARATFEAWRRGAPPGPEALPVFKRDTRMKALGPQALCTCVVPVDRAVVLTVRAGEALPALAFVDYGSEAGLEEVEVVMPPPPMTAGRVRATLTLDGEAVPADQIQGTLRTPGGLRVLKRVADEDGLMRGLPVGRFVLELAPAPGADERFRLAVPVATEVVIRADDVTPVTAASNYHGTLAIKLWRRDAPEAEAVSKVIVHLRPAGEPDSAWRRLSAWREGSLRTSLYSRAPLGVALTAFAKERPGLYDLRIYWKGRVVRTLAIRVPSKDTVTVDVELGP
ncbi:MAG: carboxypeptidase-like regulatory domain-containing protein, partial [Planctomycetota bacterium]|nr:carboxypeptidase-like regulatory domain-containing protein [Planctomycetota bacterium]